MQSIFSDYNEMKLKVSNRRKTRKFTNKYVEIKQHSLKQMMGQKNHKGN